MSVSKNTPGSTTTRQIALQQQASGGGSGGPVAAADVTGLGRAAQDAAAAALQSGTHTGASFTYDAQTGKINLTVNVTAANVDGFAEAAQDAAAAMLVAGQHTNVTVTYDDANNRINLSATGGGGGGATTSAGISDFVEAAQDAVAAALAHSGHTNVTVAYDDTANQIKLTAAGMSWTYNGQTLKGFTGPDGKEYAVLPLDASGNVKANIVPRTGTFNELKAFNGAAGEVSAATDFPALFKHTGVAGKAAVIRPRDVCLYVGYDYPGSLTAQGLVTVDPNKYTSMFVSDTSAEPFAKITLLDGEVEGQEFIIGSNVAGGVVDSIIARLTVGSAPSELLTGLSEAMEPMLYGFVLKLVWATGGWVIANFRPSRTNNIQSQFIQSNTIDPAVITVGGENNTNTIIFGSHSGATETSGCVVLHGTVTSGDRVVAIGRDVGVSSSNNSIGILGGVSNATTKGMTIGDGSYVQADRSASVGHDNVIQAGNDFSFVTGTGGTARFAGANVVGLANGAHSAARAQKVEAVMAANLAASTATQLETVSFAGPTRRKVQFGNNAFARVEIETVVFTTGFAKSATVTHKVFVKTNGTGVITVVTAAAVAEAMVNTGFATAPTVTIGNSGADLTVAVNAPETAKALSYIRAIEVI